MRVNIITAAIGAKDWIGRVTVATLLIYWMYVEQKKNVLIESEVNVAKIMAFMDVWCIRKRKSMKSLITAAVQCNRC